jgi:hypothetical protein
VCVRSDTARSSTQKEHFIPCSCPIGSWQEASLSACLARMAMHHSCNLKAPMSSCLPDLRTAACLMDMCSCDLIGPSDDKGPLPLAIHLLCGIPHAGSPRRVRHSWRLQLKCRGYTCSACLLPMIALFCWTLTGTSCGFRIAPARSVRAGPTASPSRMRRYARAACFINPNSFRLLGKPAAGTPEVEKCY